jgi:hypothetical protein
MAESAPPTTTQLVADILAGASGNDSCEGRECWGRGGWRGQLLSSAVTDDEVRALDSLLPPGVLDRAMEIVDKLWVLRYVGVPSGRVVHFVKRYKPSEESPPHVCLPLACSCALSAETPPSVDGPVFVSVSPGGQGVAALSQVSCSASICSQSHWPRFTGQRTREQSPTGSSRR